MRLNFHYPIKCNAMKHKNTHCKSPHLSKKHFFKHGYFISFSAFKVVIFKPYVFLNEKKCRAMLSCCINESKCILEDRLRLMLDTVML